MTYVTAEGKIVENIGEVIRWIEVQLPVPSGQ